MLFRSIKTRDVFIKKSTWLAQFNRKSKSCKYRRLSVFVPLLSPRYLFCLSFYFSQFVVHVLIGIIAMIFEIFKAVLSRPVRKKKCLRWIWKPIILCPKKCNLRVLQKVSSIFSKFSVSVSFSLTNFAFAKWYNYLSHPVVP